MRREPSLTFEGALQILGKHEHKTIEKIDKLLGGVILGGGAVAGAVALGVTPLAPIAAFGVVWGWIEQKGLAVDLLRSAVDAVSGKVSGLRGLEKRELIAAAHSTIVVAAIFESLRDHVGEEFYGQLKITDDEKKSLIDKLARDQRDIGGLYANEIPAPSAACGFEENAKRIAQWQTEYSFYLFSFIGGLTVAEKRKIVFNDVRQAAVERYRSRYLELAAKVPEFAIWAELGEHAATRTAIGEVGTQVVERHRRTHHERHGPEDRCGRHRRRYPGIECRGRGRAGREQGRAQPGRGAPGNRRVARGHSAARPIA